MQANQRVTSRLPLAAAILPLLLGACRTMEPVDPPAVEFGAANPGVEEEVLTRTETAPLVQRSARLSVRVADLHAATQSARSIVESHGGRLAEHTLQEGIGAVVFLLLPNEAMTPAVQELRTLGRPVTSSLGQRDLTDKARDQALHIREMRADGRRQAALFPQVADRTDRTRIRERLLQLQADIAEAEHGLQTLLETGRQARITLDLQQSRQITEQILQRCLICR